MRLNIQSFDKKTGRFLKLKDGEKTIKMKLAEQAIGRTLEEDYNDLYIIQQWGQARLSKRWGVSKPTVFGPARNGRTWLQILGLKKVEMKEILSNKKTCEVCLLEYSYLDKAHWIAARENGPNSTTNLLELCPNCHRLLDRDDPVVTQQALEALLYREVKKATSQNKSRSDVYRLCMQIINRKLFP